MKHQLPQFVNVFEVKWQVDPRVQKFTNNYVPMKRRNSDSKPKTISTTSPTHISANNYNPKDNTTSSNYTPVEAVAYTPSEAVAYTPSEAVAYTPGQGLIRKEKTPPHSIKRIESAPPAPDSYNPLLNKIKDDEAKHKQLMAPPPLPGLGLPDLLTQASNEEKITLPPLPTFGRQLSEPMPEKPKLSHRFDPRFKKKTKSKNAIETTQPTPETTPTALTDSKSEKEESDEDKNIFNFYGEAESNDKASDSMKDLFKQCDPTASPFL